MLLQFIILAAITILMNLGIFTNHLDITTKSLADCGRKGGWRKNESVVCDHEGREFGYHVVDQVNTDAFWRARILHNPWAGRHLVDKIWSGFLQFEEEEIGKSKAAAKIYDDRLLMMRLRQTFERRNLTFCEWLVCRNFIKIEAWKIASTLRRFLFVWTKIGWWATVGRPPESSAISGPTFGWISLPVASVFCSWLTTQFAVAESHPLFFELERRNHQVFVSNLRLNFQRIRSVISFWTCEEIIWFLSVGLVILYGRKRWSFLPC